MSWIIDGNGNRCAGRDYYERCTILCPCMARRRTSDRALARIWFPLLAVVLAWGAWMLSQAPLMHPDLGPWPRLLGYFSAALAPVAAGIGVWGWLGLLRASRRSVWGE